jgi:hypothetical protein
MVCEKCEDYDHLLLYVILLEVISFGAAIVIAVLEIGGFIND